MACYDASNNRVEPDRVTVNSTTYDVIVTFANPQSGACTIDGGSVAGSQGGGSSAITSVFGRTGIITAQAGDYAFSQLSGTVNASQLPSGIDAGKIAGGTVSSTAFGYLTNVRSDVQSQIDSKSTIGHSHTASGDVSGDLTNTTVTRVQGQAVAATAASDGQVLTWSDALHQWQPQTVAAGSGGGVPGVLTVTLSSATTLTIGANCSAAAPCNAGFGNRVQQFINPATVTLSSGTGTAYVYIDSSGTLTVGHNLTLTCSAACQAFSGVTSFPSGAIPIATWQSTNGTWSAQGTDWRAFLSTKVINAGQGIVAVEAGGTTTIAVDASVVPTYLTGSATLDFSTIAAGSCGTDKTLTLSGALPGDSVAPGWPTAFNSAGVMGTMWVSALGAVSVRVCNLSGSSAVLGPAVFSATVVRSL